MKHIKNILTCLFLLIAAFSFAGNGTWKLEKNQDGIKVYTRTIEGEDIREFKATTTINASRKTVASIIVDINNYANWYPDISEARIIQSLGNGVYYVYNILDLPWPASDRDGVSKMTITKSETSTLIKMEAVNGIKAESSDYVRIKTSYGFWKLTTEGENTHVHFQYFASPGGSLPDWIINMFIVDNPFETLTLLKAKSEG